MLMTQNAIFEDFAGEAVTLCRQSLTSAAEKIAARPTANRLDGQLFSIRHMLILKEMVRSVDLVQIERAADFSSVTGQRLARAALYKQLIVCCRCTGKPAQELCGIL